MRDGAWMRTEPSRRGRHAGRVHRDPGHSHPGIRSVRDRAHRVTPDPQRAGGVPGDRAISGAVFSGTSSPARRPPRPPGAAEHSLRLRRCPDPRNVLPYSSPGRSRCAGRCRGPGAVAAPVVSAGIASVRRSSPKTQPPRRSRAGRPAEPRVRRRDAPAPNRLGGRRVGRTHVRPDCRRRGPRACRQSTLDSFRSPVVRAWCRRSEGMLAVPGRAGVH